MSVISTFYDFKCDINRKEIDFKAYLCSLKQNLMQKSSRATYYLNRPLLVSLSYTSFMDKLRAT